MTRLFPAVLFGILIYSGAASVVQAAPNGPVDFARDVRPILSDKCFGCHGPDEQARKADMRLDRLDDLPEYVLSHDDPEASELLFRITADDPEQRMPPPQADLTLSEREVGVLRAWILQGAPHAGHWAFAPIRSVDVPAVHRTAWPKNEIDAFILHRLEQEGIEPAPEASRERLIRRLSFDLTGLPPTIEEVAAFLDDPAPDTYERLVDRLLARPAYGERMASDWLDTARYSDSYGYQVDRERFVWPWRDWVIKAFNENLPYDQFMTWQLAGDLLPEASDEQVLATTFCRLHPQKVEGGSVPEEFRVEYVADRTQTLATAFLGLTLQCARCHDHKYDPISQKEYYQLFAFFNNIDEAGLYSYFTPSVPTPTLMLMNDETKQKLADAGQRIDEREAALRELRETRSAACENWLENRPAAEIPGRIAYLDFEKHDDGANQAVPGKVGRGVKLTGDDAIQLDVGNFHRYEPFSVALWLNTPDVKERAVVFHRSRAWTDAGSRGYELLIEDGRLSAALIHFWPGNAIRVRTREPIPTNQWLHVAVTYDGSSRAAGLRIYVDGKLSPVEVVRDQLKKQITGGGGDNLAIGARFRDRGFTGGSVDEFQVFDRQLTAVEVAQIYGGTTLARLLATPGEQISDDEKGSLYDYYLATADPEFDQARTALQQARKARCDLNDGVDEIMVMRELPERRPTCVLRRGAYDAPGEPVEPDTPAVFPPMSKDAARNRLGLARWLTDPGNPLTARVAVNRFWQMCFGRGLVRTPEDFGSQGEPPTHPELLDWLAHDFVEHGWDVKRLLKTMVMSATYRQTSVASAEVRARDPDNRLLTRAPSYRLPAEMIRDAALAASGLLSDRVGGPPVRPYEVAVSFKPLEQDKGEGLYRRSLYTFWKRTAPAPVMMTLDASKRDVCTVKREATSSPLQALVLLNDPQRVEAARVLGQRLLVACGDNVDRMLTELFRTLTSRKPRPVELEILTRLYGEQLRRFEQDAGAAEAFLATGDAPHNTSVAAPRLAAAGVVALTLMNYDECVMKR